MSFHGGDPASYQSEGQEGPSSYASSAGVNIPPRQPLSRRGSRSNWPDASPLHHNEGTSYFQPARPISPTLSRRLQNSSGSGPNPSSSGFVRPGSSASQRRSQVRSTSVSSARPRYHEALSEEEEESEGGEAAGAYPDDDDGSESDEQDVSVSRAAQDRDDGASDAGSLDPVTLKERQSLINVEHPFGLPIWKPALYKKSRTVTRDAEHDLHSVPSAAAERHLLPGNIFWTVFFGWWLAIASFIVAALLYCVPYGGSKYGNLVHGLGWYLFWPFGKYLEGHLDDENADKEEDDDDDNNDDVIPEEPPHHDTNSEASDSGGTVKGFPAAATYVPTGIQLSKHSTITPQNVFSRTSSDRTERSPLLANGSSEGAGPSGIKRYGSSATLSASGDREKVEIHLLSRIAFLSVFILILAPLMLLATLVCWACVFTIPMAKLNMELLHHLFYHPLKIRFRGAPPSIVITSPTIDNAEGAGTSEPPAPAFTVKQQRLQAGQAAPSGSPRSTVLLCIYRAVGLKYYKYTVGGVNILFINLLPLVFFVIFDGFVLLPLREHKEEAGHPVNPFLSFIASQGTIFSLSLASVIPLSYFIGMAVASISAQSSIGMGAVINATFGSIIEIILYAIALTSGKGRLVEGSIVGSLLAGVLLMPGTSMIGGAVRKKEQKFNAKSAGVTSTMLIMAIIGTLTPTLFYQTYGDFTLICDGCPSFPPSPDTPWSCRKCYYEHLDPASDPFYQETVKSLMYLCASILVLSYLIGLWFSLRTHATQIWQNPQQLMQPIDSFAASMNHPNARMSLYNKIVNSQTLPTQRPLNSKISSATLTGSVGGNQQQPRSAPKSRDTSQHALAHDTRNLSPAASGSVTPAPVTSPPSPVVGRKIAYVPHSAPGQRAEYAQGTHPRGPMNASATGYTPFLDSVSAAVGESGITTMQLPPNLTTDDFTRAVAVATVSALRHQQEPHRGKGVEGGHEDGGHGGHDAPSWSRAVSASVLLGCTLLYAIIAELLVDVVDVILKGSGIDEKFLGVTLFALVPNTTEFMNAISFAMNDNIALSMEIGSAYALQVCLLQIPAMVAFSAWRDPKLGGIANTFTLIFPRWDVIAIILSIFLLTYTYIEAKANYYRGSILVLSYVVLTAGFYFAPPRTEDDAFIPFSASEVVPPDFFTSLRLAYSSLWSI